MSGLRYSMDFLMTLPLNLIESVTDCYETDHKTFTIEWKGENGKLSLEIGKDNYSYFVKFKNGKNPILVDGEWPIDLDLIVEHIGAVGQTEKK